MECGQGERYEHEVALLKGLEDAAGNVGEQRGSGAAAERDVAAMPLDEANGVNLLNSPWDIGVNHEARKFTFASIWSLCSGLALAPQSHRQRQFDHTAPRHYTAQVAEQVRR